MTGQPRTAPLPVPTRARGVRATGTTLMAMIRRHPRLTDAALAAVLLVVSLPPVSTLTGHDRALSVTLIVAVLLPLVWRRRAPFLIFAIMTGLAVVQFFTARQPAADLALLVALYTVAAYEPGRRVLLAGAITEAGAVLVATHARDPLPVWALLSGLVVAAALLGYYARTRRAYLAALHDRAERLERERDQQAQLAAAAERVRIAREVHDIVAHNIAVMIALADGAAYTAEANPPQAASIMGQVSATGRSALTEMRRLLGVLREPAAPGHAPQPSLDDVDDLIAGVRAAGLPTRLTVTGEPFPLPPSAQLALYRTVQEALTNTLKHAPGAQAEVRLAYRPGAVELEITDDGRPAAVPQPQLTATRDGGGPSGGPTGGPGGGHGIAGMRERAAVFGGQVSAGPRPGGGWQVRTVLPVTEDA